MQKYNLFTRTNKGFRNEMYATSVSIQQMDPAAAEPAEAICQLERLLNAWFRNINCTKQWMSHYTEACGSDFIVVIKRNQSISLRLSAELQDCVGKWREALSLVPRRLIHLKLLYNFNEFVAFNLYYMNKEENEMMAMLWQHYTDVQIRQWERRIIQTMTQAELLEYNRRILPAVNDQELQEWFCSLQASVSPEVLALVLNTAEGMLPANRLARVQKGLQG